MNKPIRKGVIAANWKMHGCHSDIIQFTTSLNSVNSEHDIIFSPPSAYLDCANREKQSFAIAAQTGNEHNEGAYTGENSMPMLADIGCQYVIIGHSERRALFHETDEIIFNKSIAAFKANLTPIFCIGESDQQNQSGQTEVVLAKQLHAIIHQLDETQLSRLIIAYEPVWAIGSGRTPELADIETIHQKIRSMLRQKSDTIAAAVRIVYGGSVKPDNAKAIFSCENVDGGLIGGASLTIESFSKIIKAYS